MAVEERAADRHAAWVGLRTLRQRPTAVGRTPNDETVYEVRSVRLLMPPGATHFRRLVQCARCRREVPGAAVLAPDDLERPPNRVFCGECAQTASQVVASPPTPWAAVSAEPAAESKMPEPGPIAAIEARLGEVTRRLNSPPAADPRVAVLASEVAELRRDLGDLAGASADAASGAEVMLDAQNNLSASVAESQRELRQQFSVLAMQMRDQDAVITGLVEAQRELRVELSDLAQQTRQEAETISGFIAAQRGDMEQALADVVQRTLTAVAPLLDELKGRQQALEDKMSQTLAEVRTDMLQVVAQAAGVASADDLRADIERRVSEAEASLTDLLRTEREPMADRLEQLRTDLASLALAVKRARAEAAQDALDAVSNPIRDLTRARQELERRLDELTTSAKDADFRVHSLEQRVLPSLAPLMDDAVGSHRPPGGLLASLDRQLREAEERLAQR